MTFHQSLLFIIIIQGERTIRVGTQTEPVRAEVEVEAALRASDSSAQEESHKRAGEYRAAPTLEWATPFACHKPPK